VLIKRPIDRRDLTSAALYGCGLTLTSIKHPTEDVRLPLYVELWRALACLVGNVWREVRS
jgi:hypothetical protein